MPRFYYIFIPLVWGLPERNNMKYNDGMSEKIKRVYVDSSVVSGMFDKNDHPEKTEPFWKAVFGGKIRVVMSDVLEGEVARAPLHVRAFYRTIPESQIERIVSNPVSDTLATRYV
jgi:hypothetical protein